MLYYIVTFFVLAIVASLFGFSGLAVEFAGIAKLLAGIFIVLFLITLIYRIITGKESKELL
jgi:uncharacterized membrane protein YtjA (UPF0391 family)